MISIIEKTIDPKYRLPRKNRDWLLNNGVKLRAPSRHSFAFSLDNQSEPSFAFFNDSPPKNIAKMCDAIVAMNFKNELCLFIIEQKTQHPGEYRKQLSNGKHFCNWLFSLYEEHKYYSRDPVYIGLLISEPRPTPPRETTTHQNKNQPERDDLFHLFKLPNTRDISLAELAQSALSHQKKGNASPPEKRISNLPISPKTNQ